MICVAPLEPAGAGNIDVWIWPILDVRVPLLVCSHLRPLFVRMRRRQKPIQVRRICRCTWEERCWQQTCLLTALLPLGVPLTESRHGLPTLISSMLTLNRRCRVKETFSWQVNIFARQALGSDWAEDWVTAYYCIMRAKRVSNCYMREKKVCVCVCSANRQNTVYLCLSTYIVFQFWIGACLPHPPDSTKEICYGDLVTRRSCDEDLVTEILWQKLPHTLIPIVFVKLCPPRTDGSFLERDTSTHTKLNSLPSLVLNLHESIELYHHAGIHVIEKQNVIEKQQSIELYIIMLVFT